MGLLNCWLMLVGQSPATEMDGVREIPTLSLPLCNGMKEIKGNGYPFGPDDFLPALPAAALCEQDASFWCDWELHDHPW